MGTNLMTVWPQKRMAFAIADASSCENAPDIYAPTSALRPLSLPFQEHETILPQWTTDPFFQSMSIKDAVHIISAKGPPRGAIAQQTVQDVTILANTIAEFPGSLNGTDTKSTYDHRMDRENRIIPLLTTDDGNIVARLDIHAGGPYKHSSIAVFGFSPQSIVAQPQLRNTLVGVADYILHTP